MCSVRNSKNIAEDARALRASGEALSMSEKHQQKCCERYFYIKIFKIKNLNDETIVVFANPRKPPS